MKEKTSVLDIQNSVFDITFPLFFAYRALS